MLAILPALVLEKENLMVRIFIFAIMAIFFILPTASAQAEEGGISGLNRFMSHALTTENCKPLLDMLYNAKRVDPDLLFTTADFLLQRAEEDPSTALLMFGEKQSFRGFITAMDQSVVAAQFVTRGELKLARTAAFVSAPAVKRRLLTVTDHIPYNMGKCGEPNAGGGANVVIEWLAENDEFLPNVYHTIYVAAKTGNKEAKNLASRWHWVWVSALQPGGTAPLVGN